MKYADRVKRFGDCCDRELQPLNFHFFFISFFILQVFFVLKLEADSGYSLWFGRFLYKAILFTKPQIYSS